MGNNKCQIHLKKWYTYICMYIAHIWICYIIYILRRWFAQVICADDLRRCIIFKRSKVQFSNKIRWLKTIMDHLIIMWDYNTVKTWLADEISDSLQSKSNYCQLLWHVFGRNSSNVEFLRKGWPARKTAHSVRTNLSLQQPTSLQLNIIIITPDIKCQWHCRRCRLGATNPSDANIIPVPFSSMTAVPVTRSARLAG